jgi:hypothetical protein
MNGRLKIIFSYFHYQENRFIRDMGTKQTLLSWKSWELSRYHHINEVMVSFYAKEQLVVTKNDRLFVFVQIKSFILVAVCSTRVCVENAFKQCRLLYAQLIFSLSQKQLDKICGSANFDLYKMMGGIDVLMDSLTDFFPLTFFDAKFALKINQKIETKMLKAWSASFIHSSVIFGLLVSKKKLLFSYKKSKELTLTGILNLM